MLEGEEGIRVVFLVLWERSLVSIGRGFVEGE